MKPMPLHEYLADPCPEPSFSSGAAWSILSQSPRHAWNDHPRLNPNYESIDCNSAMDIGSAAHALFLENDDSRIVPIEADSWRTKAAKEARDEAHANGYIPLLLHQRDAVMHIVDASRAALAACDELANIFDGAAIENACLWQDGGTWCRARPDLVSADYRINLQYKTTEASAEPGSFGGGALIRSGYHLQAYHQARGIADCCNVSLPSCVWLVQETTPPYAASVIGMAPSLEELAKSQWEHALRVYMECLQAANWPGYPSRICWVDAKNYEIERWAMREDRAPLGRCKHDVPAIICQACKEEQCLTTA